MRLRKSAAGSSASPPSALRGTVLGPCRRALSSQGARPASACGYAHLRTAQHIDRESCCFRHRISVLCGVPVMPLYFNTHGNTPHEEFQSIMRKTVQEWLDANDNGRGNGKKKSIHLRILKRRATSKSRTK